MTRFTAHGSRDLVRLCVAASWLAGRNCHSSSSSSSSWVGPKPGDTPLKRALRWANSFLHRCGIPVCPLHPVESSNHWRHGSPEVEYGVPGLSFRVLSLVQGPSDSTNYLRGVMIFKVDGVRQGMVYSTDRVSDLVRNGPLLPSCPRPFVAGRRDTVPPGTHRVSKATFPGSF